MTAPLTPDFIPHAWTPLAAAELGTSGFVHLRWPDGTTFEAYSLWLAENAEGYGLEPSSRESMLEPRDLPAPGALSSVLVDDDGALVTSWDDGRVVRVHPGWLRHVADERHLPFSVLPDPVMWTAADFTEPPTLDGSNILDDDDVLEQWLATLVQYGLCRLAGTPTDLDFVGRLVAHVGPIRDTNFGPIWSVRAKPDPDSTAYTGLDLGQHTDLPTREVPPGFQFLHCVENTVQGGWSRMSDGWAVAEAIRIEHPDAYDALTNLEWVFCNRATDAEHRWIGPMIDHGSKRQPLTLRAFYPVRTAPHMAQADIPRAYDSLRVFATMARDPRFQLVYPFRPGDLVGFDNRRILHGRDAFESAGSRHLRGCYADHDDLYSRLRVLRRDQVHRPTEQEGPHMSSVFITCAVTGSGDTVSKSEKVPVTPIQIADNCIAAAKAGAAVVHIHVRDPITGTGARHPDLYAEVVDRVRSSDVDVVLNLTAGMGGDLTFGSVEQPLPPAEVGTDLAGATERLEHVRRLMPEICTLDCGTMNFGEGDYIMTNSTSTLKEMARQIQALGVRPEIEAFDTGHLWQAKSLAAEGLIDDPAMIQLCMGVPWGAPPDLNTFMAMVNNVPESWTWSAFSLGRRQMEYVALAAIAGGNIRVGLEDNLYLGRGQTASNADLVTRAVEILDRIGYGIKSPDEVRAELKLTKHG